MSKSGLSNGVRRRNARLRAMREIVRRDFAIVGIDLASRNQALVIADHDSVVVARRMFRIVPAKIGEAIEWACVQAREAGFTGVVVACEPTGHRWKLVVDACRERGIEALCVHTLLVHRARESEDLTKDKSDFKDALLIARLAGQLHGYVPYKPEGLWARLRHLGERRRAVLAAHVAARQCVRDLLECVWPEALDAAAQPLDSRTWLAAMSICDCDPGRLRALGHDGFVAAVAAALPAWGAQRRSHRVMEALWRAADRPGGIASERAAACERAALALGDLYRGTGDLAEVEARMLAVLNALGLTELVTSITGLSAVTAAAILAETGDPTRFAHPRAWVKHAGFAPRQRESGTWTGQTRIASTGRPELRTAAWRALWGLLPHNHVFQARYQHLRTRNDNPLNDGQARAALCAALLRQLFVVVTDRVAWDAEIAAGRKPEEVRKTA